MDNTGVLSVVDQALALRLRPLSQRGLPHYHHAHSMWKWSHRPPLDAGDAGFHDCCCSACVCVSWSKMCRCQRPTNVLICYQSLLGHRVPQCLRKTGKPNRTVQQQCAFYFNASLDQELQLFLFIYLFTY